MLATSMTTKTTPFDAAEYLKDCPEAQAELLKEAIASGDATFIASALETIARAREMSEV